MSAVYGRTVQWETQKKGLRPLAELPNVVLLFLLLSSMCIAFINIFVKVGNAAVCRSCNVTNIPHGIEAEKSLRAKGVWLFPLTVSIKISKQKNSLLVRNIVGSRRDAPA